AAVEINDTRTAGQTCETRIQPTIQQVAHTRANRQVSYEMRSMIPVYGAARGPGRSRAPVLGDRIEGSDAGQIAAGAAGDPEVAVCERERPGDDGVADRAVELEALEDAAVDLVAVGAGADDRARGRVVDHEVGVGADPDRALARVEAEDLGR